MFFVFGKRDHRFSRYIEKFRYPANATHSAYGTSKSPAANLIFEKRYTVAIIRSHRIISHTNANR